MKQISVSSEYNMYANTYVLYSDDMIYGASTLLFMQGHQEFVLSIKDGKLHC